MKCHQEAGRTETTLQRVVLTKRPLKVGQLSSAADSFDRRDRAAIHLGSEQQARSDRSPVDEDRARPTDPVLTTDACARQIEVISQKVREQPTSRHLPLDSSAIDRH